MTFEDLVKSHCTSRCMSATQAQAVFDLVKAAPENEAMANRWGEDVSGYDKIHSQITIANTNYWAIEWIDKNLPKAFFRPMFTPSVI